MARPQAKIKGPGPVDVSLRVAAGLSRATIQGWARSARRRLPRLHGGLSVVVVGPAEMRRLNNQYRRKNKPTNVLSFAGASTGPEVSAGEIFLCPVVIRREAQTQGRTYREYFQFLLQHGLIHLLGLDHHSELEYRRWQKWEKRLSE